jgi:hypothetical protein
MVLDVKPIADLHAIALNRQGLASQGIDDHKRDQFFWEMIGSVIVGAIGGQHRQTIGVVPCGVCQQSCPLF